MKRIVGLIALLLFSIGYASSPAQAGSVPRHATTVQTVVVRSGDTYSAWAVRYCGTFNSWHTIQAANGWPERAIPVGVRARIVCTGSAATAAPATHAAPVATSLWVHPLASGKRGNSCYGWRASTHSFHGGVDMAQPRDTPIRAASSGTVYKKAFERGGAGYYVVIKHPGGAYTLYAHMVAASPLAVGASVSVGRQIGRVGTTGNSTGPHLHFEVRVGGPSSHYRVNPATFMRNNDVNIGC